MVQSLSAKAASVPAEVPVAPVAEPAKIEPSMSVAREALMEIAIESGIAVHEGMTKEELIEALNKPAA